MWKLQVQNLSTSDIFEVYCHFLIYASGVLKWAAFVNIYATELIRFVSEDDLACPIATRTGQQSQVCTNLEENFSTVLIGPRALLIL
jgi:hypothetical protein